MQSDGRDIFSRFLDSEGADRDKTTAVGAVTDSVDGGDVDRETLEMELLLQTVLTPGPALQKSQDRLLAKAVLIQAHRSWRNGGRRWTRSMRWGAAVLITASMVGAVLWTSGAGRYPGPSAQGDFRLLTAEGRAAGRTTLRRGDRLVAGPGGATLVLGGYCELVLDPGADVVLHGEDGAEEVELNAGRVVSRVTPGKGGYRVVTPLGALDVMGTEFATTVAHPNRQGAGEMDMKRTTVAVMVMAGLVGFDFGAERGVLSMGGSRVFAAEEAAAGIPAELRGFLGILIGTVEEKADNGIALKVAKVAKTWPRNRSENPAGAVGKTVFLRVNPEKQRDMAARVAAVKVGAEIAVGGAHREGNFLGLVEVLVPAVELPALQERWAAHAREREAREARAREERERRARGREGEGAPEEGRERGRAELEAEVRRLREENARLKRMLEARRD